MINRSAHRYGKNDHIALIQANLKEMKDEVSQYLKKSSIDKVPHILNARHYLIVDYMNNNASSPRKRQENQRIDNLCSQQLKFSQENGYFSPMREDLCSNKKIIIKKRSKSSMQQQATCLLPSICNINLQYSIQKRNPKVQRKIKQISSQQKSFQQPNSKGIVQNQQILNPVQLTKNIQLRQKILLNKSQYQIKSNYLTLDLKKNNSSQLQDGENKSIQNIQKPILRPKLAQNQNKVKFFSINYEKDSQKNVPQQTLKGSNYLKKKRKENNLLKKEQAQKCDDQQTIKMDQFNSCKSRRLKKIQSIIFEQLSSERQQKSISSSKKKQQNLNAQIGKPVSQIQQKEGFSFKKTLYSIKKATLIAHKQIIKKNLQKDRTYYNNTSTSKFHSLDKQIRKCNNKQSQEMVKKDLLNVQKECLDYAPWSQSDSTNKKDFLSLYLSDQFC